VPLSSKPNLICVNSNKKKKKEKEKEKRGKSTKETKHNTQKRKN
jgi:hypothetical protein